jgi:hypothetical protein
MRINLQLDKTRYSATDAYCIYLEEIKDTDLHKIEIKKYLEIVYGYFQFLLAHIFDGKIIMLPERLGNMFIRGQKKKLRFNENGDILNGNINWKATKELWNTNEEAKLEKRLVYNFNEHTNGYTYSLIWKHDDMYLRHHMFYTFDGARYSVDRKITQLIKEGKEYITKEVPE